MDLTPEQMGLQNPYSGATSQPSGAINPDAAPAPDVMQPAEFAANESDVARAIQQAPAAPSWLAPGAPAPAAQQTPPLVDGAGQPNWDSDSNPYKRQAEAARPNPVREIQAELTRLPYYTQQTIQQLVAGGYDQEHATQLANAGAMAIEGQYRAQLAEALTMPAAEQMVAEDIAKRLSVPGVVLTAADLKGERSPAAMMARGRALVESRRSSASTQRVAQRVDTVEAPAHVNTGAPQAPVRENPFQLIKAGLASYRR